MTTVLIADDNPADIDLITLAFEESGKTVEFLIAANGAQAIEQLRQASPSLVLLDINMPRVDGFEVLKYLRGQPHLINTRVIIMSSSMAPQDKDQAMNLGANAYWVKPSRFEDTVRFIGSLSV